MGFFLIGYEFLGAGLYELFVAHFCPQTLCNSCKTVTHFYGLVIFQNFLTGDSVSVR